jgi:hypothetical protein
MLAAAAGSRAPAGASPSAGWCRVLGPRGCLATVDRRGRHVHKAVAFKRAISVLLVSQMSAPHHPPRPPGKPAQWFVFGGWVFDITAAKKMGRIGSRGAWSWTVRFR